MPLNKDAITRYRLIDERLRNSMLPKPSLDQLIEHISRKMEKSVSRRTILLDIKNMKDNGDLNYHAPIVFDHYQKGYYYSEEGYSINNMPVTEYELQGLEIAIGILQQFNNLQIIKEFESAILKIADAVNINRKKIQANGLIHLDTPPRYKGLEWVPEIANAIRTREVLRIRYQSFDKKDPKEYRVEPYHLREYNNRFYVFAKSMKESKPGLRTFGLDRIIDIWPTDIHFEKKSFDETGYFKNMIGISALPDEKPQKVVLSFTPQQGKYIKAQPLHQSQEILKDNDKEYRISLELVVNYELMMILLSYGSKVKVIQPKTLADKIKEEAVSTLKLYS